MPMNFRTRPKEEPEINLIPFIDVLLVVLIFLMLTTTYAKFTELKINLPTANAQASKPRPKELVVLVTADGRYVINGQAVEGRTVELLTASLTQASQGRPAPAVTLSPSGPGCPAASCRLPQR